MKRAAILASAILAALSLAAWQGYRAAVLRADLAKARELAEMYAHAAKEHSAHVERLQGISAAAAELDRELQEGEGGDKNLSDFMRDAAGRLWR